MIGYDVHGGIARITIDNPPVNALGPGVLEGIAEAVRRGVDDAAVRAIVLVGAGSTFVAGADIKVFTTLATREASLARSADMHAQLRAIEDAPKPVVAAIHGHALGGGLELAMACHFRVAMRSANVGQPEVLLGLIPGAGGTQRLPRLAGAARALEMCTDGQPISAADALDAGIVDTLVDGDREALIETAERFAAARADAHDIRRTRDLTAKIADLEAGLAACDARRAELGRRKPSPLLAPWSAINAIEAAHMLDFDAGSLVERDLFSTCLISTESRALIYLFFAEREATKVLGVSKATPAFDIARAAVVGAGTMGRGIAMAYANAGIPVLLMDEDGETMDKALISIQSLYEASVAKGKITQAALEHAMSLITPTARYDKFKSVDIVVEAVFEDFELKKGVFRELGQATIGTCLLASNTSSFDIDALAQASGRPDRVVGHHFFSPANVMKLVEIVRGRESSPETLATSLKLAKRLGKIGVVVGNCSGFVANRMLGYYMREACLLLEEGACVAQIDRVLTEFGLPVGPFAMQDIVGLDVGARIRQHLKTIGRTRADGPQCDIPDRLFEMRRYGQKIGAGWYRYEPGSQTPLLDPLIEELAEEAARRRGIRRHVIDDEEIVARVTTALANEGARILEEGYAARAGDIDIIYCYGFGFPRYRGGPMFYADTIGLETVLNRVLEYRVRFGDYWRPAPLLERLAAEGRRFTSSN